MLPKEDDTIDLSDAPTNIDDVICWAVVALIPAAVFNTTLGAELLPLSITFATISKPSSIDLPPIATNFAKPFVKFSESIVSSDWTPVAWDGYR
jgi:hypothetical protein